MDERKPHHILVERLISKARHEADLHEFRRQMAGIDGRPMPDPETHPSPPRPTRRKTKGTDQ